MPEAGSTLEERYRLIRELGSGGMGTVWAAEDERLGRTVAVKQLHTPSDDGRRRFLREAQLGASLRHPNLVTVYDIVTREEDVLLIMEYVEGHSLSELMRERRLHPDEALRILEAAAAALDHAHAADVVHRDVKPGNLLVGRDGKTRLADLGIATAAEITRITRTGSLLGTPAYMAPEQLEGEQASPATDVYALATVAFEALSGARAWTGRTPLEVMQNVRSAPTPDVREARPELPEAAAEVLRRGMARDPSERPASAGELVRELAAAFPLPEPAARRAGAGRARSASGVPRRAGGARRALPLAALLLVAAGLVAIALGAFSGDDGERRAQAPTATATAEATETAAPGESPSDTPEETPPPPPAAEPGSSPTSAVRGFYERAASDDFAGAWELAGPGMRAAFGNDEQRLGRDLASLESIEFLRLDVVERGSGRATLAVETVARHTDRTDRCSGTLAATRSGDGVWQVEPAGLSCEAS